MVVTIAEKATSRAVLEQPTVLMKAQFRPKPLVDPKKDRLLHIRPALKRTLDNFAFGLY
jgi:hypothetical protein